MRKELEEGYGMLGGEEDRDWSKSSSSTFVRPYFLLSLPPSS